MLGDEMRRPDVFRGQAQRTTQAVVVFPPRRNVAVKKLLERGRSPRADVNTIGNRFNGNLREHLARSLSMHFRDAINIRAEAQRKLRHVEGGAASRRLLDSW